MTFARSARPGAAPPACRTSAAVSSSVGSGSVSSTPYSAIRSSSFVLGATGIDQVRQEHGVVRGRLSEAEGLCVVTDDGEFGGQALRRRALPRDDHLARPRCDREALDVGGDADATSDAREIALAPVHLLRLGGRTLRRRQRLVERVDAAEQRAELEPLEDLLELGAVGGLQDERRRIDAEVEVATHRREELLEARACSASSAIAFERAGESPEACSTTSSSEPYCAMSCPAVLSPIPGIPGMLSLVSPFRPMKSGICSGRIPYRASTRSGVYTWTSATPRGVIIRQTFSETSWNASRSVETTQVLSPASSASVASVAMTSSASHPSNSRF